MKPSRHTLTLEYDIVEDAFYPVGGNLPFRLMIDLACNRASSVNIHDWALRRCLEQGISPNSGMTKEDIANKVSHFAAKGALVRKFPPGIRKEPSGHRINAKPLSPEAQAIIDTIKVNI